MIEEHAVVARCIGSLAEIEASNRPACGTCEANGACSAASLARLWGHRRSSLRAHNPIGAQPGERVIVGLHESALIRASFIFYLLPLAGLIGSAIAVEWLVTRLALQPSEPVIVVSGLLGLLGGLLLARWLSRRLTRDSRYQAVILRRAGPTVRPVDRSNLN